MVPKRKRKGVLLRPPTLNKILAVLLGSMVTANVVDVGLDKDFRSNITTVLVNALTISGK